MQTRSADVVPAAETYVLGWQIVHAVQDGALAVVLNCPLGQLAQMRSPVLDGAVTTSCPAVHE